MRKRTLKVALLAALATILVLSFSSVALADQTWSDLPDTVTAKYGITDNQVAGISDGFPDGTWKPFQAVTRAQFTKMAVMAFGIPLANPATPSFTDVPKSSIYYPYIEGAKAAAVTNGTGATTFSPNAMVTRQQAVAMVSRWVAQVNGYNLATMYTADQITALLAHFGDAASISSALKAEVAFAYDMGITTGDAYGNFAPLANMMRIQGAAFLIRAQGLVPPANWTAANIEQVTDDKTENLIGKAHSVTFKVTTADGHPAKNVLVDFDTLYANPLYVGNVSPQAAMTDSMGMVTVNLNSAEPGTQRLYATIVTPDGLQTEMATKYWLALDEVYLTDPEGEAADIDELTPVENNAGDSHTFCFRVVVFGPGPLSSGPNDWYNAYDPLADPADIDNDDAIDAFDKISGDFDYEDELYLWNVWDLIPRTMADVDLEWDVDWNLFDEAGGSIVSSDAVTDEDGLGCITIKSTSKGSATVSVVADYMENPYPKQLIDHSAVDPDEWDHNDNWEDQPDDDAHADKTWIPHVIGGDDEGPITPAYAVNNTGEVEQFDLELKDVYGNPIAGYTVEWWIQGAGFFKIDDDGSWAGIGEQNKDIDVTDADGMASVWLKSLAPGQTIVHCKVMDKYGLPYKEWNVVKQWYSIDEVIFAQIVDGAVVHDTEEENVVGTGHTWVAFVGGAKYVYTLYDINMNGLRDDQALLTSRAELADYEAGDGTLWVAKMVNNVLTWVDNEGAPIMPGMVYTPHGDNSKINGGDHVYYTAYVELKLSGAEFMHDVDKDTIDEVWSGLAGKTVYFYNNIGALGGAPTSNTELPTKTVLDKDYPKDAGGWPIWVGDITSPITAVTNAGGVATVDINSTVKGWQFVYVVADYRDNPQDGDPLKPLDWAELRWASADKLWIPAGGDSILIGAGMENPLEDITDPLRVVNPVLPALREGLDGAGLVTIGLPNGTQATGTATISAGVVTGLIVGSGGGGYKVAPAVTIAAPATGSGAAATATVGGAGTDNQVIQISVTAGGTGYTVAPTVVIGAPQIPGGTQATATANIAGGNVVSVTIVVNGSGYTAPPAVSFTSAGTGATGTAVLTNGVVTSLIVGSGGSGYTAPPVVTIAPPVMTQATAHAVLSGDTIGSVVVDNPGAGYATPPVVTFAGPGSGAAATATVANGAVTGIAVTAPGSGYVLSGGPIVDNPNWDILAVQVFDAYGNALEDYKVTWEVVGQGTTTPGTIDTYHPFAHFEDPDYDEPIGDGLAGVGDLNPYVNSNAWWGDFADGVHPQYAHDANDDDYAWGWTLNQLINFELDLVSAAHVTLVMDETRDELVAMVRNKEADHFTDIVNIKVYDPDGALMDQFEVTKVWDLDEPVIDSKTLEISTTADGPWSTTLATNNSPIYYRIQLLDQYGDPWTDYDNYLKMVVNGPAGLGPIYLGSVLPDSDGYVRGSLTPPIGGTWTLTPWNDTNDNGLITPGELTGNSAVLTFTGQPQGGG